MDIEYYEIIVNDKTKTIGLAFNSREYQISEILNENQESGITYIINEDDKSVTFTAKNRTFSFKNFDEEDLILIKSVSKILLMSGMASAHEDEAPEFEGLAVAHLKV